MSEDVIVLWYASKTFGGFSPAAQRLQLRAGRDLRYGMCFQLFDGATVTESMDAKGSLRKVEKKLETPNSTRP